MNSYTVIKRTIEIPIRKKSVSILLVSIPVLYSSACSFSEFNSYRDKDTATITFSNTGSATPELSIKTRGKSYSISHDMITQRHPNPQPTISFNIPADEEIIIAYNNYASHSPTLTPILKCSTNPVHGCMPDFEQHHNMTICSKNISFAAQKNKQYEVSVESTYTINCKIEIKETSDVPSKGS